MSELEAGIVGADAERLADFYERALGFELTDRLEFEGVGVVRKFRRGDARMKLFAPVPAPNERVVSEPWYACAGWRYAALYVESPEALHEIVAAVDANGGDVLV